MESRYVVIGGNVFAYSHPDSQSKWHALQFIERTGVVEDRRQGLQHVICLAEDTLDDGTARSGMTARSVGASQSYVSAYLGT